MVMDASLGILQGHQARLLLSLMPNYKTHFKEQDTKTAHGFPVLRQARGRWAGEFYSAYG